MIKKSMDCFYCEYCEDSDTDIEDNLYFTCKFEDDEIEEEDLAQCPKYQDEK